MPVNIHQISIHLFTINYSVDNCFKNIDIPNSKLLSNIKNL